MKKISLHFLLMLFLFVSISSSLFAESLSATVNEIKSNPAIYNNKEVTVSGFFSIWKNAPGAPPISRSDWVICDGNKNGLYCVGTMPSDEETGELQPYWKPIDVTGIVMIKDDEPFIKVNQTKVSQNKIEKMVTIRKIILNQIEMKGECVGVTGVLAKGYGMKGERMYLIADPTGAIRISRTAKLYPKGTILHIKGIVSADEYGIPMIDNVEVISAKVD